MNISRRNFLGSTAAIALFPPAPEPVRNFIYNGEFERVVPTVTLPKGPWRMTHVSLVPEGFSTGYVLDAEL